MLRRSPAPSTYEPPPDWERRRKIAERSVLPWIEDVMPLSSRTVLEYGCGNGAATAAFAPRSAHYIGLDIDSNEISAARQLLAARGVESLLLAAPAERILAETAAFRGEVDIFLCYAVLEHMTVKERLSLLELAREVVRDDGVIVVAETPNRLTPWDYHTSRLPFLNQVPEELALRYFDRSERIEFVEALQAAKDDAVRRETFARWGRARATTSSRSSSAIYPDTWWHQAGSRYSFRTGPSIARNWLCSGCLTKPGPTCRRCSRVIGSI
jgi:cyclopropane fatty-acyl-phospholipid synthase-like methyltransferase